MSRYTRQEILPELGHAGQFKISNSRILIVGAGGLGVPAFQYLVGAGVGEITLIDPDHVSTSNLHRQPIYGGHEGESKAHAAAEFARSLNRDVSVKPVVDWLTPVNAAHHIGNVDLVLDCADSFAVSYILSDLCFSTGKPLISASALGLAGYVGGFCGGAPSMRAVFPDLPDNIFSCETSGVLGPVVGMLGLLQAQMALAHIVGLRPSPLGQLIRYDMKGFRSSDLRFDAAQEPAAKPHQFIAVDQILPSDCVVDLRGAIEAPQPVVSFAKRLQLDEFRARSFQPDYKQRVVLACRSGLRAWRAADLLREHWDGDIKLVAVPYNLGEKIDA